MGIIITVLTVAYWFFSLATYQEYFIRTFIWSTTILVIVCVLYFNNIIFSSDQFEYIIYAYLLALLLGISTNKNKAGRSFSAFLRHSLVEFENRDLTGAIFPTEKEVYRIVKEESINDYHLMNYWDGARDYVIQNHEELRKRYHNDVKLIALVCFRDWHLEEWIKTGNIESYHKYAHILITLVEKVELNRRSKETLIESNKKAIANYESKIGNK